MLALSFKRFIGQRESNAGSGITGSRVEMRVGRSNEIVKCITCKTFLCYVISEVKTQPYWKGSVLC